MEVFRSAKSPTALAARRKDAGPSNSERKEGQVACCQSARDRERTLPASLTWSPQEAEPGLAASRFHRPRGGGRAGEELVRIASPRGVPGPSPFLHKPGARRPLEIVPRPTVGGRDGSWGWSPAARKPPKSPGPSCPFGMG